jgi:hypothetical protein
MTKDGAKAIAVVAITAGVSTGIGAVAAVGIVAALLLWGSD